MRHFTFLLLCLLFVGGLSAQSSAERVARADELATEGRFTEALSELEYVDLDSLTEDYYRVKFHSLFATEQGQDGWETLNAGIQAHPKSAKLLFSRGIVQLYMVDGAKDAAKDFDRALKYVEVDSMRASILMNLGAAHFQSMNYEKAYDNWYAHYLLDTTDVEAILNLSVVMDEIGRGDETLYYLHKALEADSTYYSIYGNIGYKYQSEGDYETSMKYYGILLEKAPDDPLGYSNQSFNRMKMGDLEGAMRDADRAVELDPYNSFAWKNRGLILLEMKEPTLACESFEQALRLGYTKQWGDEVKNLQREHCRR